MKVLLIEDQPQIQRELSRTLRAIAGVQLVHVAATEQQATDWLKDHPQDWDLAVVDLFLGQGHGFRVLRSCERVLPWQRVVVLSNYVREPVREFARLAGADAFFDKSLELEAFVQYCVQRVPEIQARETAR